MDLHVVDESPNPWGSQRRCLNDFGVGLVSHSGTESEDREKLFIAS